MESTRLASRDNYRDVEKEWQYEFIYYVLESIGIPEDILQNCFPEEGIDAFTTDHKIELRKSMNVYDVTIIDDKDGGIKIFVEREKVAEWKKCNFVLKEDVGEIDPAKRLYIEIIADTWTIFDQGR